MELYYALMSPPCRSVLLLCNVLNLKPKLIEINLLSGEHLTTEFKKLNPQHTIPVLKDGDFILTESRAILCYLAEKHDSPLYPKDLHQRARVNERLYYDIGTLYSRFQETYMTVILRRASDIDKSKFKLLEDSFGVLEEHMKESDWIAGSSMTIADISLAVTISTAEACCFDLERYPRLIAWLKRCRTDIKNFGDICDKGSEILGNLFQKNLEVAV